MFHYLNHRFHWNNISFQIPDGYYLDSDPEMPDKNSIWLISPKLDFRVSITITTCSEDTLSTLSNSISDMNPQLIAPIAPISFNGLRGHHAAYRLIRPRYYEIFLDLGLGELLNVLMWSTNDDIYDKTAEVIAALDFRCDKE